MSFYSVQKLTSSRYFYAIWHNSEISFYHDNNNNLLSYHFSLSALLYYICKLRSFLYAPLLIIDPFSPIDRLDDVGDSCHCCCISLLCA